MHTSIIMPSSHPWLFSHDDFDKLDDIPNESTLEVNITHEQLTSLTQNGEHVVALSPTRYDEGHSTDPTAPFGKGYDITFSNASEIVLQHKAPTRPVVRGQDNQNKRQWLQYDIDLLQVVNLAIQYDPRQAFLALPMVAVHDQLDYALDRTIFVDVWDIFARLQQQHLATDYILVEYLPIPFIRPSFTDDSVLTVDEYHLPRPVIRGKYAGSNWAMHYDKPDPYYAIAYGDGQLFAAQPWTTLRKAFHDDDYGLSIRGLTRTDGSGEFPHDEWFDFEIADAYDQEYREHLKRKYALHQYAQAESEEMMAQLENWLLIDLDRRYHRAVEQERLDPVDDHEPILPPEMDDQYHTVEEFLSRFQSTPDPLRYRLHRTHRYIHQSGGDTNIALSV